MKIRNGFVSNSSSSSFILIGRRATIEEIDNPKFFIMGYGDLTDGKDYFYLTNEMKEEVKEYIKNNNKVPFNDYIMYIVEKIIGEEYNSTNPYKIQNDDIGYSMFSFDGDYHHTDCLYDFERRYLKIK